MNAFYDILPDRDYLPGEMSMPKPLSSDLIENYLMKNPSNYDMLDIKQIIRACDEEYISINAQTVKDKLKRK